MNVLEKIRYIFDQDLLRDGLERKQNLGQFVEMAHSWVLEHGSNYIQGLEGFKKDFSAGTTQSFDSFYLRHRGRRMRCLQGEYFYHIKTWLAAGIPWSFISDSDPLTANDALIISVPFCDTGNNRGDISDLLGLCDRLGIPVLIDCCYWPISSEIYLDVAHDCVDTVAFSLSKAFPVAHLRIGWRYTRRDVQDGQSLLDNINYNNTLSAFVGSEIVKYFSCDFVPNIYREKQKQVCDFFNLEPSQSILFGIGDKQWNQYSRSNLLRVYGLNLDPGLFVNRISLVSIFDNWDIFQSISHELKS